MAKNLKETPKQNNALHKIRKKVIWQAVIAVQTIVITIALIFGMTAAWYTNVLQTSGLQFEAAAWGFSGQVVVADEAIQASPGDTGIIGLSVANSGDEMVDVAVNVSKIQMDTMMQKRLFFYVETSAKRNEETMERVYINTRDSYSYTLLGRSDLTLSEEHANDSLLKWQWVYDMLGYYFLGTVTETTLENGDTTVLTSVEDYLRPVEYDLDTAVFDENGLLKTANGLPVADFLKQLGETDGYNGGITATDWPGYYQVSVDENGYGIWVYLNNWAEIQQATTEDSLLGMNAANLEEGAVPTSYTARLTVVGQLSRTEYTNVSTVDQLITALNDGGAVQLQNDLELTSPLVISSSEKAVLDLNGYTIQGPSDSSAMTLKDNADLIVMNGDIVGNAQGKDLISVSGSSLTLSEVDISGHCSDAIEISDQAGAVNSTVRLFESTLNASSCAVHVYGNGSSVDGYTKVVVENSTLNSGYIAICGNGTSGYWGTDVQIYNSTVTGEWGAVYQPQADSITRVLESNLSGFTGVIIKGGDLVITDSTVTGTGTEGLQQPAYKGNGYSDTGDGIYVECGYGNVMNITISGDNTSISSTSAQALRVFEEGSPYAKVNITGGNFSTNISAYLGEAYTLEYDTEDNTYSVVEVAGDEG